MKIPLKTVVFVDDEPLILKILRNACTPQYQVIGEGANGLEAITLVKTVNPQILIMDLHMPVMDGMTALRQIVALQTTAVVMLTADSDPKYALDAMDLGASGYLLKPFELSQVVPMLETSYHRFQTSKDLHQEVAKLSESLETRKLLERAKGILMEQQGFTEDEAHKTLQKMSQDQGVTLKEVCRSLIQVKMLLGKSVQKRAA